MRRVLLVVLLLLVVAARAAPKPKPKPTARTGPRDRVKEKEEEKRRQRERDSQPKSRLDVERLPPLQEVLQELGLQKHLNKLVRMGAVDTRTFIRLGEMDYRMMQLDHKDVTSEDVARLRAKVAEIVRQATIIEAPKRFDLEDRKELKYGRVYLSGAVQAFEFLSASFGSAPPLGPLPYRIAENPSDGCYLHGSVDLTGQALVVRRGSCTYLAKAKAAAAANASALVVVNWEDKLDSPASGYGVDPSVTEREVAAIAGLPVVLLSNTSWSKLAVSAAPDRTLSIVPLKCGASGSCVAITPEELSLEAEVASGSLTLSGSDERFEFLSATYGGALPLEGPLAIEKADPIDACSPLKNNLSGRGPVALLVNRGGCRFDTKSFQAQEAGARLTIVMDPADSPLQRMGGQAPDVGYVGIPSIMVPPTFGALVDQMAAGNAPVTVSVHKAASPSAAASTVAAWAEVLFAEPVADNAARRTQLLDLQHRLGMHAEVSKWLQRRLHNTNDKTEL